MNKLIKKLLGRCTFEGCHNKSKYTMKVKYTTIKGKRKSINNKICEACMEKTLNKTLPTASNIQVN